MVRERNKKVKSSAVSLTHLFPSKEFCKLAIGLCFYWKVEVALSGPQMKKEKLKLDVIPDSNLGFKREGWVTLSLGNSGQVTSTELPHGRPSVCRS